MRITGLRQQKRRRDRVSVFLDEEFWIGITERLCNELGLFAGEEISSERKGEIEELALSDGALQYAFDRLGSKLLPEKTLRQKLRDREYSPATIDAVIERCSELHLLDDRLWAETVAEERAARAQGRRRVAQILQEGGINSQIKESVLDEVFPPDRELDGARAALESKYRGQLNPDEQRRAWNFLLRRGFPSDAAKRVIEEKAMDAAEEEELYGWEEALLLLERRFPGGAEKMQVRDYLRRRSFSSASIEEALRRFDRFGS